jgi:hypothetical protein
VSHFRCLVALLGFATASACGRVHSLEEGPYLLSFTAADVFRDDCGLTTSGLPGFQLQLVSFGDFVQLAYVQRTAASCLPVQLAGQYQYDTQNFYADGTASNPLLPPTNGGVCNIDFVSIHLDATTSNSTTFSGVLRANYIASSPIACNCELWLNYRATLCAAPACMPPPSGCP